MRKLNKQEQVFLKLLEACREPDAYSVLEMCLKMRISYDQLKAWTKKSAKLTYALEICHMRCELNVDDAAIMKRLSIEEAVRYLSKKSI